VLRAGKRPGAEVAYIAGVLSPNGTSVSGIVATCKSGAVALTLIPAPTAGANQRHPPLATSASTEEQPARWPDGVAMASNELVAPPNCKSHECVSECQPGKVKGKVTGDAKAAPPPQLPMRCLEQLWLLAGCTPQGALDWQQTCAAWQSSHLCFRSVVCS
jgi:hypothetical protein